MNIQLRNKLLFILITDIQYMSAITSPSWFWTIHFPFMLRCLAQAIFLNRYAYDNLYFNSRVWDGFTRNDFKKGELLCLLHKLKIIKQLNYDDDDGRGYFIGYLDD